MVKQKTGLETPSAFLSHSSVDGDTARRLAKDLRSSGIDVWYAEWEIKPGDSLRRKIDEGIDRASHFLVLLTENSLKSEWVQTELDAAMVKRIEGSCRLIPVLWGIGDNQVPATLRGVLWVKLDAYDTGLRRLIEVCFDVDTKPPLGQAPSWTQERPLNEAGLSTHAQRLAALLNQRSETGTQPDPLLGKEEVTAALGLTEEEVAVAADELEERGLVQLHKAIGMGKAGFYRISPTSYLFFETDVDIRGRNTETDARTLAAAAVNTGKDVVSLSEIDKALSWGPRRINPAADYLALHGYVNPSKASGHPYSYPHFIVTPRTKRFANSM